MLHVDVPVVGPPLEATGKRSPHPRRVPAGVARPAAALVGGAPKRILVAAGKLVGIIRKQNLPSMQKALAGRAGSVLSDALKLLYRPGVIQILIYRELYGGLLFDAAGRQADTGRHYAFAAIGGGAGGASPAAGRLDGGWAPTIGCRRNRLSEREISEGASGGIRAVDHLADPTPCQRVSSRGYLDLLTAQDRWGLGDGLS